MASKGDEVLSQFMQQVETQDIVEPDRKVKVGIIGTGWIAGTYAKILRNMPDVDVVAGADLIEGKAEAFFKKHEIEGVRLYPDHTSLLAAEELDAVFVCTYNATHSVCTVEALNKGINVLVEKPMSVTLEEAVEMCRAEKKSGKLLSIGFQPRFDANMKMVKKVVESGELGKVYYVQTGGGRRRGIPGSTFIEKSTGGIGALGDIGCYSLDMVLNALGYPKPLTISGYTSNFFGTSEKYNPQDAKRFSVDDFAAAFIRLEGDIILDFRIAWAMNINTPGDTVILGKDAGLRIPSTDCWNGTVGGPMKIYREVAGAQVETEIPIIANQGAGIFEKKIRSFVNAIKSGAEAPVPSGQILYNQAILDGITRSAELGREIEVKIPEI